MAGQGQRQIIRTHPATIIRDADQGLAAISIGNVDPTRPGINGVFDQLFDGRGRAFHDLARRNPVDCGFIKLSNNRVIFAYIGGNGAHATRCSMGNPDSAMRNLRGS